MPGISVSKICVPFGGGGINWSSYWATRKPSALIVTGNRDTEIDFSWTDNSAGDCTFAIYRSTDGVTYSSVGTTVAGDTTYTATGLTAGNLYYFYVKGVKSGNESDPTNIYDTRFKITVDTTKAGSAADTFVLPLSGTVNAYIDWGDGGAEQNVTTAANHSHTYAAQGTYQVKVRGAFGRVLFNNGGDKLKVSSIDNWGNIKLSSFTQCFMGCANMQGTYVDVPNTTASMTAMNTFYGCAKFNWPVNNFYTASITNMTSMFYGCTIFNQPMSNWNTGNVTLMGSMLRSCLAFNQDISNFNVKKVTDATGMLNGSNAFSRENYDKLLIAWAAQTVIAGVAFHAGDATYTAGGAAEAARAVLTSAPNSWTITDGGPSFNNGKLVITSDDGYASIYTTGFPALVAKGVVATFYVCSDLVGEANRATWAQLLEMQTAGMDIQCHFNTHTDLRTLNEAQILAGLQDAEADFVANGLPAPSHHAYPYGYYSDDIKTWVATERLTGRIIGNAYAYKNTDKFQIPVRSAIEDGYVDSDIENIKVFLDHAKAEYCAVIFLGHRFGEAGYVNMTEFDMIIDYAQSIGLDIITMSQLYALMI